jgi:pimeloyl-ACP methyl ester carboxylesterase
MPQLPIDRKENLLAYAEYGNPKGYPILAQHGLIASIKDSGLFDPLVEYGARVICIARPGYGDSSPCEMKNIGEWGKFVSALVDHLGLTQFDVLGMSSGAPYAYAIGNRFPLQARNLYIYSGIPAMYDDAILKFWPFEVKKNASLGEMQKLAKGLFFSNLAAEDLARSDTRDSMANGGFGIAQDFRLRVMDWGFKLEDLKQPVIMRHARYDTGVPFVTAEMTSKLIQKCELIIEDSDVHFSTDSLADFFVKAVFPHLGSQSK